MDQVGGRVRMEVPGRKRKPGPDKASTEDILCEPCGKAKKKVKAEGFCKDCEEYLCSSCFQYHKTLKALEDHTLLDKTNMPSFYPSTKEDRMECTEKCNDHEDEKIKFFCPAHGKLGCGDCVIMDHRVCQVDYIPKVSKGFKDGKEYKDFITEMAQFQKEVEYCASELDNCEKFVNDLSSVGCVIYTLVGFILNPKYIMKYVSLILLVFVYGYECFSGAYNTYSAYCKVIHKEIQSIVGDRLTDVASQTAEEQENTMFRVPSSEPTATERMRLVGGSEGYLKWRAPRLVLFLDNSDIPYIPKRLLFHMAKLPHVSCPGPVHLLYLSGLLDFLKILIFLFFVFIVIFAFGQASDISSGGQTIAALGSGFLPLVFRKFLFSSHGSLTVEKNLKWQGLFSNAVKHYVQRWNFDDIFVTPYPPTNDDDTNENVKGNATGAAVDIVNETRDLPLTPIGSDNSQPMRTEYLDDEDVDLVVVETTRKDGEEHYNYFVPRSLDNRTESELIEKGCDDEESIA